MTCFRIERRTGSDPSATRRHLRTIATGEPTIDQIEFIGREDHPLRAAARDNIVAEPAGKDVHRRALLEPGIRLAHDLKHKAHFIALQIEAALLGTHENARQRLRAIEVVLVDFLRHCFEQLAIFGRG